MEMKSLGDVIGGSGYVKVSTTDLIAALGG
jgi:hypothetical protein